MNNIIRRVFLTLLWLLLAIFTWQLSSYFSSLIPTVTYDPGKFTPEQQIVYEEIVAQKKASLPSKATTETGEVYYIYKNQRWAHELPDWYQDGEIVLTPNEQAQITNAQLVQTPSWLFWQEQMTLSQLRRTTSKSAFGFMIGPAVGLMLWLIFGFRSLSRELTPLFVTSSLISGLIVGHALGLASGLAFLLLFWLTLGLASYSRAHWTIKSPLGRT